MIHQKHTMQVLMSHNKMDIDVHACCLIDNVLIIKITVAIIAELWALRSSWFFTDLQKHMVNIATMTQQKMVGHLWWQEIQGL